MWARDPGSRVGALLSGPDTRAARRRRLALSLAAGCFLVLIVGLVWIVVTGLVARSRLHDAQARLQPLKQALVAGDLHTADRLSAAIRADAGSAHALVSGPAWWVAAHLPVVGTPLATGRTIAGAAHRIGEDILPGAMRLAQTVQSTSVHTGADIHLPVLMSAQRVLDHSHAVAVQVLRDIRGTAGSSWLPSVDSSRELLLGKLGTLDDDLDGASRALRLMIPMLGGDGPRRYFVGFENEAESRGLGGLAGAFAVLTVQDGQFRFTHFGTDKDLEGVRVDVDLGPDYQARYRTADPTGVFQNSDIGPDFRDAATIWAAMWERKSGEHVDGAMAIDPTALSYLLRVTGPSALPTGGEVSADNVVALTQQTQYSLYSDNHARKRFLVGVARAVADDITSGRGGVTATIKALSRAARERRVALWSSHPAEERQLIESGLGAVLSADGAPFTGFTVVNAAGSKLDYYLDRTITYTRDGCSANGTATATISLTNNAPPSGLPSYVTFRLDRPAHHTRRGDNFVIVTYYGTPGATVTGVQVDGRTIGVAIGREHGLLTASFGLELPMGRTRDVTVTLIEPSADKRTVVLTQPSVRPAVTNVSAADCSG